MFFDVLLLVFVCVDSYFAVTVPPSPCPKLFNYFISETYETFGAMTFNNDLSGTYDLIVNMSIAMDTDKNIHIRQVTPTHRVQNGENIEYYVLFPYNHTFPRLTSVSFNGKVHCVGPPETATADHGVTALSASEHLKTQIIDVLLTTTTSTPVVQIIINNINNKHECGKNIDFEPLLFSGTKTRSGEYPWLVAIFLLQGVGGYGFRCAGNLISAKHVITAAHCLYNQGGNSLVPKTDLVVALGQHNIKNWVRNSTVRSIAEYFIHPDYRKPADADIAVLLLDEPVTFRTTINPVCVWDEVDTLDVIVNASGTVVGWGMDESGRNYIEEPKQLEIPIVSHEICLWSDARFVRLTSQRTFCAGNRGENRGPCTGDSGGGFIMKRNGIWKLRGVVSVSLANPNTRLCDVNNFVVFSDVAKYLKWLEKILATQ